MAATSLNKLLITTALCSAASGCAMIDNYEEISNLNNFRRSADRNQLSDFAKQQLNTSYLLDKSEGSTAVLATEKSHPEIYTMAKELNNKANILFENNNITPPIVIIENSPYIANYGAVARKIPTPESSEGGIINKAEGYDGHIVIDISKVNTQETLGIIAHEIGHLHDSKQQISRIDDAAKEWVQHCDQANTKTMTQFGKDLTNPDADHFNNPFIATSSKALEESLAKFVDETCASSFVQSMINAGAERREREFRADIRGTLLGGGPELLIFLSNVPTIQQGDYSTHPSPKQRTSLIRDMLENPASTHVEKLKERQTGQDLQR
jgi:hypothetical protein